MFDTSTIDPAERRRIDASLDTLEVLHGVHILWAVESGSRAWGFPSPDSDYDCRFIYIRPVADYLTLFPPRDVIEMPIEGDFDINGWDLGKALKLLLNGNAVVIEWLTSPLLYRGDPTFRLDMLRLAGEVVRRERLILHYLHLGRRQRSTHFADGRTVPLKKLFYVLRPAMALRWLRLHPDAVVVPMHLPTLHEADVPPDIIAATDALIARKAVTRELGVGTLPEAMASFIESELGSIDPVRGGPSFDTDSVRLADAFFLDRLGVNR